MSENRIATSDFIIALGRARKIHYDMGLAMDAIGTGKATGSDPRVEEALHALDKLRSHLLKLRT